VQTNILSGGLVVVSRKVSSKSIEDSRMAIEIFLKAFLSLKENLTDKELRRQIGHDLELATDRCIGLGLSDLTAKEIIFVGFLRLIRGTRHGRTFGELWFAYRIALYVGTTVLRNLTGRIVEALFTKISLVHEAFHV